MMLARLYFGTRLRLCPPGVPFLSSLSLSAATCASSLAWPRLAFPYLAHSFHVILPVSIDPFSYFVRCLSLAVAAAIDTVVECSGSTSFTTRF